MGWGRSGAAQRGEPGFPAHLQPGAALAEGDYLCFLNNDTVVTHGWLEELVRSFRLFPGAGLVGSMLLYPDGRLQEAGGIVWRDGSAWNYGRGSDPRSPEVRFARDVDYVSGASILVPTDLFRELGDSTTATPPRTTKTPTWPCRSAPGGGG